jgi:hypothetical protein
MKGAIKMPANIVFYITGIVESVKIDGTGKHSQEAVRSQWDRGRAGCSSFP